MILCCDPGCWLPSCCVKVTVSAHVCPRHLVFHYASPTCLSHVGISHHSPVFA